MPPRRLRQGLKADLAEIEQKKLGFFYRLPQLPQLDEAIQRTLYKCFSVMKSQIYTKAGRFKTRWTTPDRLPHRRLWLWDSVFHSMGNKYISFDLAYESITAVLDAQEESGFIPHMADPSHSSNITQPPVLAWGLYTLCASAGRFDLLAKHYEQLEAYLQWNIKNRDCNHNHLFEWLVNPHDPHCRCDECGMDNSPRFDNVSAMDCIDFSCFMANEALYMRKIAESLGRGEDASYWRTLYDSIKTAVNSTLWDEDDSFYYDRVLETGALKKVASVASFLPLFCGICSKRQAEALAEHLCNPETFHTAIPVPSIAASDKTFGSDMWRGPIWINYNYMIIKGLETYGYYDLAQQILHRTIETVSHWYLQDGTIYEFYDSTGQRAPSRLKRKGSPVIPYDFRIRYQAIRDYGWSCSLFAAMVLEHNKFQ